MRIICDNEWCIYEKEGTCLLETVELDNSGMCTQCIRISLPSKEREVAKSNMRKTLR